MFHDHKLTRHAEMRMRQRGVRDDDLRLLLKAASQVSLPPISQLWWAGFIIKASEQ